MVQFNVIIERNGAFKPYDIIPYFVKEYRGLTADKRPKTLKELRKFVEQGAQYQFWGRCEFEIILVDWPVQRHSEKWDVHQQIMMNIDTVTELVGRALKLKL